VAIGRASDYFGPRGGAQSMLGDRVIPAALAGKTATVLGDPDQPHTYIYIPDIGEASLCWANTPTPRARSGTSPTTPTPGPPASWSTPSTSSPASPRPSSAAPQCCCCGPSGSPTQPSGSCSNCSIEFQEPFVVDSTKIAAKLDVHATPLDQALADTLSSYRTTTS
jgi:hypothetical protein